MKLSEMKQFPYFFWFYNAGLAITVTTMEVRGIATVLGHELPEQFSFLSGAGHILIMLGLIVFFMMLGKRLDQTMKPPAEPPRA